MSTDDVRAARVQAHLEAAKKVVLDPEVLRQVHRQHRSGKPLRLVLELDTDVPLVDLLVNAAILATQAGVTAVRVGSLETSEPSGSRSGGTVINTHTLGGVGVERGAAHRTAAGEGPAVRPRDHRGTSSGGTR